MCGDFPTTPFGRTPQGARVALWHCSTLLADKSHIVYQCHKIILGKSFIQKYLHSKYQEELQTTANHKSTHRRSSASIRGESFTMNAPNSSRTPTLRQPPHSAFFILKITNLPDPLSLCPHPFLSDLLCG